MGCCSFFASLSTSQDAEGNWTLMGGDLTDTEAAEARVVIHGLP